MKTAVEFLQEQLSIYLTNDQKIQFEALFQQAMEKEREQIIDRDRAHMEIKHLK